MTSIFEPPPPCTQPPAQVPPALPRATIHYEPPRDRGDLADRIHQHFARTAALAEGERLRRVYFGDCQASTADLTCTRPARHLAMHLSPEGYPWMQFKDWLADAPAPA